MPSADYQKIIETVDSEIGRLEAELANLRKVRETIAEAEKIAPNSAPSKPHKDAQPKQKAEPLNHQPPSTAPLGEAEQRLQRARQRAAEEMTARRAKR